MLGGMDPRRSLGDLVASAISERPSVAVDAEAFAAWVRARLEPEESPDTLHIEDLLIAYACTVGNSAALTLFEREFMPAVERGVTKAGVDDPAELTQRVRSRLLVSDGKGEPRLATYRGTGPLQGWLRVCGAREALMARRAASPPESADGLDLAEAIGSDPELHAMKAQASDAFQTAFSTTMRSLPARERLLLQYEVVDGLNRDEIAELFGVHPSSISRWLAKARSTIRVAVRLHMSERLEVSAGQLDSLMRLIESRLDVSLRGALVDK